MVLIIGGQAQGKLAYARAENESAQVCDGESCPLEPLPDAEILNNLHLLIRRLMKMGKNPMEAILPIMEEHPDMTVICDEVGCGIVPADRFEREWREMVGRICCVLAARASRVERIYAGIAVVIKGDKT